MRIKSLIIILYFIVFWLIFPFLIFYASLLIDKIYYLSSITGLCWIGYFLVLFTIPLLVFSIAQFKKYGKELPVSAFPPKTVVQNGIYAVWRHPVYLFFSLLLLGIGLCIESTGFLIFIFPCFLILEYIFIFFEEKTLKKRYGKIYENYKKRTSLIIPKLPVLLKVIAFFLFKTFFKYQVYNSKNIPQKPPFIIISAHRNYLDPFFISLAINIPVSYVTTYEVYRNKLFRFVLKHSFSIPKLRYKPDILATKKVIDLIEKQSVIGIFPEGERSWTGDMNEFKPETLKLFKKYSHIPILPVIIEGNYHIWPRWAENIRRAKVKVKFGEPVHINSNYTPDKIEKQLSKLIQPADDYIACKSKNIVNNLPIVLYRCPICFGFETLYIKGKNEMNCSVCKSTISVMPDYKLKMIRDNVSIISKLGKIYENIKITQADIKCKYQAKTNAIKNDEEVITESGNIFAEQEKNKKLTSIGNGNLCLTNYALYHLFNQHNIEILLKNISSVTIESNFKVQIYEKIEKKLYQFKFYKESALKWQDYIVEAIKCHYNFTPNTR